MSTNAPKSLTRNHASKITTCSKHHITTVTSPHGCVLRAGLVDAAFTEFLKTPKGQTAALEFIKHDLGLEEKVA
jgi:hypothetical protein